MTKPLISILTPTRGRVNSLRFALDSCVSLAKDQSNLEFIFKVDDDDQETIDFVNHFATLGLQTQIINSPRGNGYRDMHLWMNEMASIANGQWLFIYNDDAQMATQHWDFVFELCLVEIKKHDAWHGNLDVCCLAVQTENRPGAREFFFIPKKMVDILGCVARIPHVDTWLTTLLDLFHSSFTIPPIVVRHQSEVEDEVRKEGLPARQTMEYTRKAKWELLREKLADATLLLDYLEHVHKEPHSYAITDADTTAFLQVWEEFPEPGKINVLEVGAHDEPVANILAHKGYNVYGIDMREYNPLQDIKDNKEGKPELNYTYIRGDFCDNEYIRNSVNNFDVVICLSAIEHFGLGTYGEVPHPYYDVLAMRWIWHMLKEGGVCYLTVPYGGRFIEKIPHWRIYNKKELYARLIQDFEVVGFDCFVADKIDMGNGNILEKGIVLSMEEADSYMGTVPHISALLKLKKVPVNRTVVDGR